MKQSVVGWDIGGAHVKAVMLDGHGTVIKVSQRVCPLWQGIEHLQRVVTDICTDWQLPFTHTHSDLDAYRVSHAVTMTGELVDLFQTRAIGVAQIAHVLQATLGSCHFYAASDETVCFVPQVAGHETQIASMNWHASALAIANRLGQQYPHMIVVDIGSTTTDITACVNGGVQTRGWTDAQRMREGSLFYTGVVRTALMAFGPYLTWQGFQQPLAAEYFATTADVYRLLGDLSPEDDLAPTADGQDKSTIATMRRLARMVGQDVDACAKETWIALASAFKQQQITMLMPLLKPLCHHSAQPPVLVGLGTGQFLVATIAQQLGVSYLPAHTMITADTMASQIQAAIAFPAYAVARVWQQWY